MEYKAFEAETKDIDGRIVTGIASVFGNVDAGQDRVHVGAFKKTLKEGVGRVKHFWQHEHWTPPTAVIRGIAEVGRDGLPAATQKRYPEATGGLEVQREYLDTERGNEILAGIKAGAITEMSFAFDVIKAKDVIEDEIKIRNLQELRLWETSDVTWGMNQATVAAKAGLPVFRWVALLEDLEKDESALRSVLTSLESKRLDELVLELRGLLLSAEPRDAAPAEVDNALTERLFRDLAILESEMLFL